MKKNTLAIFGGRPVRTKAFKPHPVLGKEERKQVLAVLKSGLLSGFIASAGPAFLGGPKVKQLESLACKYFKVPYAVAMNSATSALHAALSALGIGPNDQVVVSPFTMSASAAAILMQGAVPIFVDIDENTFCIDPTEIERKITPRTKAIVVVHLFGQPAAMREIQRIAEKYNLFIVEDCAQAPGSKLEGNYVGTIGHIGVFSLNQHKTITTGEGGIAVTKDKRLALRLQLVRNHGEVVVDHLESEIDPGPVLGWNYRMTELEAAVGVAQFKKLDRLNKYRIRLAEYLVNKLSKIEGIETPLRLSNSSHVYFVLALKYDEKKIGIPRDLFIKAINAEGIPFGGGYVRPIYLDSIYRNKRVFMNTSFPFDDQMHFELGDCPVSERMHFKELITTNVCRFPSTFKDMDDVVRATQKIITAREKILSWAKKNEHSKYMAVSS